MFSTGLIILIVVEALALLGFLFNEKSTGAFLSFAAFAAAAQFGFDVPVYQTILANPMDLAMYLGGFFLCGALYSLIRWRLRQDRIAAKIKAEGLREKDDEGNRKLNWAGERLILKMKVSHNKSLLTSWITFWPIDLLVLIGEEPVQRIYEWLTTRYQAISRQALEKHGMNDLKDQID